MPGSARGTGIRHSIDFDDDADEGKPRFAALVPRHPRYKGNGSLECWKHDKSQKTPLQIQFAFPGLIDPIDRFQRDKRDPSVIVFSEIQRCQLPHATQFFKKQI